MAENSEFATTILTSTSPSDVANFIPHSLDLSQNLIEKNLVVWFSNYTKMLIKYNQDLNLLVANGRDFFSNSGQEFGSIDKIWNCVASCVTSQIGANDSLIKVMRNDILSQLSAATRDDVRFSELVVNSKELTEISQALEKNDPNGEYQWNVKAPAVLSNFENFKRNEKNLLSSSFLSYMNAVNSKTSEVLHKNENAVNYILKEFNVDQEMNAYVDYMVNSKVQPPARDLAAAQQAPPAAAAAGLGSAASSSPSKNHSSRASVSSGSGEPKKKSKLRSKMGSLLGRKKKNDKHASSTPVDAIPEDQSVSSVPSRQNTSFSTRHSLAEQPSSAQKQPQVERGSFVAPVSGNGPSSGQPAGPSSVPGPSGAGPSSAIRSQTFNETVPLQPSAPQKKEEQPPVSSRSSTHERQDHEGPNLVKYTSSDEDSDGPTDAQGNRLSMLQTHQLDHPPKVEPGSEDRSRNTSSGKYSFDYGDEEKDLSAKATPKTANAPDFPSFGAVPSTDATGRPGSLSDVPPTSATAANIADEVGPPSEPPSSYGSEASSQSNNRQSNTLAGAAIGAVAGAVGAGAVGNAVGAQQPSQAPQQQQPQQQPQQQQPPPPPPSRKVHSTGDPKINRRDLHSGTFQNLPPARESMIQPRIPHDEAGTRTSLVSQNTGNSFFRHDNQFKHFGSSQALVDEGLHTSVAEIINVTFKDGNVTKAHVLGEVAFNYNSVAQAHQAQDIVIPVPFTKFLLNEQFMRQVGENKYSLDLSQIASRTLGGLKYIANLNESQAPVVVRQIWKFEPHQASLIIKLSHNPVFGQSVQLEGLVISASLDHSAQSTSASSKPEGSFNKDKNRITWRYMRPLVLDGSAPEEKLIARFTTNGQASEAPTGVQLKFNVVDPPTTYVPILDVQGRSIPSFRSLSTGSYISHA
ncbi:hypothetical protein FT663_04553 [Candidozyma haemuli var. vulneris]|uniref:MHD domain-containing protein n=1 Tax=Candidozyma haemuli TaxID=45357 RepID=A0A2V1B273_9ASCO|nr:hypothetical protein CXQ85_003781 [[Candida] haemuloni]KAF3987201.1 hypothetical protein FT663_04553 [[Candida] haemuloni var. vulneris]PVH23491.1 hypothetical protein CXQ85_003781 [[Candida] haemuloni]